jgi:drug/metabolite transporter (DMT)-like permease
MIPSFLTTLLFSLSAVSGRRLALHLHGTKANLLRLVLGAALLGTFSHARGFGLRGAAFPWLFLSGCVGFGLGDLALFQSYPRLGARRTVVLSLCLAAPMATLIEWAWLGHAPTPAQAGYAGLILAGVGLALLPHQDSDEPVRHLRTGILFGLVAAFGQGFGAVLSRKAYAVAAEQGQVFAGVGDGLNAAYQRMLGGILVSALFLGCLKLAHKPDDTRADNWSKAWPLLIVNSLCGPALGVTCYQWALITAPTHIVMPIIATTPLAVIPLAHFLDGDRVTRRAVLGGALAVGGVIGLALAK